MRDCSYVASAIFSFNFVKSLQFVNTISDFDIAVFNKLFAECYSVFKYKLVFSFYFLSGQFVFIHFFKRFGKLFKFCSKRRITGFLFLKVLFVNAVNRNSFRQKF